MLNVQALAYTLTQLAQRTGWQDDVASPPIFYGQPDDFTDITPAIIIIPTPDEAWGKVLTLPPHSLTWLPAEQVMPTGQSLPVESTIPVLFWGAGYEDGSKPFAEQRADGSIIFYVDIIAAAFFMLSRWEETVVKTRDEHGRFPATASVAYKQGLLDLPLVDLYALILREWIKVLRPDWEPTPRPFQVRLSHDIDFIKRFPDLRTAIRVLTGDLFKRRSLKRGLQTVSYFLTQMLSPEKDIYFQSINTLAKLSYQYQLESDFYFMTATGSPFDDGYDLDLPQMRASIDTLQAKGFRIGFHSGYNTFNNPKLLADEKARMDATLGQTQYGGRQHFLRFQAPLTWRHWEQVGLTYDSTLGYAMQEGFRCGTCHPYKPFDIEQDRELDLWEYPLIVMDVTLHQYRNLTPEQGEARIIDLAQRCKDVEGTFTLLWHNSSFGGDWEPWEKMYRGVLPKLADLLN